ncbi:MAG TPA: M20 family metallopeptidase [Burkholderiaceae bacterium]|nr:M20 family metallopeptidase [Burkholderiaceae bacterium]
MSKSLALEHAEAYFENGSFERELAARVACRSVSLEPDKAAELLRYLTESIQPDLEAIGFVCRYLDNPVAGGAPFLLAERMESPDALTLLTYGHGDVVPGYDDQWTQGLTPWVLAQRDGAWYGRGVADNKGQHTINLAALREVIAARGGRLGYNVKMLYEMGEERSSPGLREICARQREALSADVFIASDGPRISKDQPTLFLGSRGHVIFELACAAREGALHSGNWGGIMKNPATILCSAIGSLVDGRGRITIAGLLPPPMPEPVREALSLLVIDSQSLGRTIDADWGEPGMSAAERLLGWNTLEVLTLHAGNAAKPANAIPPRASAHCQLRFVVGTNWKDVEAIVRRHLDEAGFADVQVRVLRGSPATRLSPASPWVGWARKAVRAVTGADPAVIPNLGGTVPNDAFSDILGLPTVWIPHSYPGCRQHAPNEHLPLSVVREGLAIMTSVFWELGEEGARIASRQHRSG